VLALHRRRIAAPDHLDAVLVRQVLAERGEAGLGVVQRQRPERVFHAHVAHATLSAFSVRFRALWSSTRLRSRIAFGVTSTSSSSLMNSSAASSVMMRGGVRKSFSSAAVVRMLVSFFAFDGLTTRSLSRECMPTIMPM